MADCILAGFPFLDSYNHMSEHVKMFLSSSIGDK